MTEERQAQVPPAEDDRAPAQHVEVWRLATWLVPVAVQAVLAVWVGVMWLLSQGPLGERDAFGALVLTGVIVAAAAALLVGGYMLRSAGSPRRRAVGLSVAGSGIAVFVAAATYALLLLPWLKPD